MAEQNQIDVDALLLELQKLKADKDLLLTRAQYWENKYEKQCVGLDYIIAREEETNYAHTIESLQAVLTYAQQYGHDLECGVVEDEPCTCIQAVLQGNYEDILKAREEDYPYSGQLAEKPVNWLTNLRDECNNILFDAQQVGSVDFTIPANTRYRLEKLKEWVQTQDIEPDFAGTIVEKLDTILLTQKYHFI